MEPLKILEALERGLCTAPQALERLRGEAPLGFAHLDLERRARRGFPEFIFGEGKSAGQLIQIIQRLLNEPGPLLATRVNPEKAEEVQEALPELRYAPSARALYRSSAPWSEGEDLLILSAGSSDAPVAEEALLTARLCGLGVALIQDVGVAGLHRLISRLPRLRRARVIIVVAGMDGALPSVTAGLLACPIIAVPSSVGYGANFGGLAALLAMLNACAAGVTVVNIDNGFGAACAAALILGGARE